MECADGDEGDVCDVEFGDEIFYLIFYGVVDVLFVVDKIHFVYANNEVGYLEECGDKDVAVGLFDNTVSSVDEDEGEVGGGCTGDHVPGVLDMSWGVCDDEFSFWCSEVAVGDVDGDSLFSFCSESVGEEGKVEFFSSLVAEAFKVFELVLEDGFAVVEESSDEGAFSVINASGGGESEKFDVVVVFSIERQKYPSFFRSSIAFSARRSSARLTRSEIMQAATSWMISWTVFAVDSMRPVQVMSPTVLQRTVMVFTFFFSAGSRLR